VSRLATTVEPSALSCRLDAGEAVAASLAALPAPPAPEWDAVARELLTARCPFLALAVHDTRLRPTGADAAVKKTALAAVARRGARAPAAQPAAPSPPPEDVAPEADGEGREETQQHLPRRLPAPCEDTPGGRERLLRVLRDAGCVRLDPS
jgi:hypothetical protein